MSVQQKTFDDELEAAIADIEKLSEAEFIAKWRNSSERLRARCVHTLRTFANSEILEA